MTIQEFTDLNQDQITPTRCSKEDTLKQIKSNVDVLQHLHSIIGD